MAEECFKIDGVAIAAPETYKPVFSTTSTKSTKRDQALTMHNSVMGTIAGYDMTWGELTWTEIATILNALIDKKSFTFHHKDPRIPENGLMLLFIVLTTIWMHRHWKRMLRSGQAWQSM